MNPAHKELMDTVRECLQKRVIIFQNIIDKKDNKSFIVKGEAMNRIITEALTKFEKTQKAFDKNHPRPDTDFINLFSEKLKNSN